MPVNRKKDSYGSFYQWGDRGEKYYYQPKDKKKRQEAKTKAVVQGRAIIINQNKSYNNDRKIVFA